MIRVLPLGTRERGHANLSEKSAIIIEENISIIHSVFLSRRLRLAPIVIHCFNNPTDLIASLTWRYVYLDRCKPKECEVKEKVYCVRFGFVGGHNPLSKAVDVKVQKCPIDKSFVQEGPLLARKEHTRLTRSVK